MSSGPHVTHVIRSLEIGGMERLVHELVRHRSEGPTSVVCLERKGHFGQQLEEAGYAVHVVGMEGGLVQRLWRLQREMARLKPDVLHCHNLLALTHAGVLNSARFAPRMLTTKHGCSMPAPGRSRHVSRWIAQRTRMVAVSHEVERVIQRWCRRTRYWVPVIPNGVAMEVYSQTASRVEARQKLGYAPEHFVIGIVARLVAEKDHRTLLQAFQTFHQKQPRSRLAVIGDGPLRWDLVREADCLGITSSVSFLGERHDVPELLSGLDVFALSSHTEGLPMTILEAMAASLPIVATNVGGVSTAVEEGVTGYLIEPRSPFDFSERFSRLARDHKATKQMGQAARRKLEKEFTISQTAARYEEIYCSL